MLGKHPTSVFPLRLKATLLVLCCIHPRCTCESNKRYLNNETPPPCVRYVDIDSEASEPDGLSWETAFTTVQDGIDAAQRAAETLAADPLYPASSSDARAICEVWVAEGTYTVFVSGTGGGTVLLKPRVELYGGFTGVEVTREERDWREHEAVLDGQRGDDHVCVVVSGGGTDETIVFGPVIDGFTIRGGDGHGEHCPRNAGGAMLESPVVIRNCLFTDNMGHIGAALTISSGSESGRDDAIVDNCTFTANFSNGHGAALVVRSDTDVEVTNCLFDLNSAVENGGAITNRGGKIKVEHSTFQLNNAGSTLGGGGAIHSKEGGTLDVRNCLFSGNIASPEGGGGISIRGGTATISDSLFENNSAGGGGAVCIYYGSVDIDSCIFFNNNASAGGAIINVDGVVTVTNATISSNHASTFGGSIFNDSVTESVEIRNSVLWSNLSDDEDPEISGEVSAEYSCVEGGYSGTGNIDQDPLFTDAEAGNFHLLEQSPCIDAANGPIAPGEDYDGQPRVDDPQSENTGIGPPWADIGAIEYQ